MVRRFLVDLPAGREPRPGDRATLDADEARHLRTVLRLEAGATVQLTDGRGHALEGELLEVGKQAATVAVTAVAMADDEVAPPRLHLACAVVKGRRFEYALEKAVELGAHTITPLVCERGVVDARAGKQDRWRGLLVAALKQCGRCHLPELTTQQPLDAVLRDAPGPVHFGAAPGDLVGERPQAVTQLAAQAQRRRLEGHAPPDDLVGLVGPEGGWTAAELQGLAQAGAVPLVLGPHVLRTETAAAITLAALQEVRQAWRRGPA
ncbi:RsmE family RNA methyltransferase [bacterium]|nr:RsmE family RNA methyltransferase [bacterium]